MWFDENFHEVDSNIQEVITKLYSHGSLVTDRRTDSSYVRKSKADAKERVLTKLRKQCWFQPPKHSTMKWVVCGFDLFSAITKCAWVFIEVPFYKANFPAFSHIINLLRCSFPSKNLYRWRILIWKQKFFTQYLWRCFKETT